LKPENDFSSFNGFRAGPRRVVRLTAQDLVTTGYLESAPGFPLVMQSSMENVNLLEWAAGNRELIEEQLLAHGAILFRGFSVESPATFESFIKVTAGQLIEYSERSSPRSRVSGRVYTSTDYPSDQAIFLHNEQSYNITFPMKIVFFCMSPASSGGETPIADTRRIYQRISPRVREQFIRHGYLYVRNFGDGFGLSWQDAFQTTSKSSVENYCRDNGMTFQWKEGGRLRTAQVRRVIARHPRNGETAWFNHLTFFHISTLARHIQELLRARLDEENLPNNTYYGDGSRIEPWILDELREAYLQEKVIFPWQKGDILMLDNMLAAHGREPYAGARKVLVGMAETRTWQDIL